MSSVRWAAVGPRARRTRNRRLRVELEKNNRLLAETMQDLAIEKLSQTLGRRPADPRRRSPMRLRESIKSPENVGASAEGFGWFDTRFMDSVTPYWRQIDEGSSVHVGQRLRGMFVGPGGVTAPNPDRAGTGYFSPGAGASFIIRNPIRAHNFVRAGESQVREWGKMLREILGENLRG